MNRDELLDIKLKAFKDENDAKILDLLNEIIMFHNDPEMTSTFKDIAAVPEMLSTISEFMGNQENMTKMPIRDVAAYILAMKEFSEKLKPIYIKILLYKEMKKND